METIIVELRNKNALKLLKDLELAKIIRILDKKQRTEKKKLSTRLRGTISKDRAKKLNEQLDQMRKE